MSTIAYFYFLSCGRGGGAGGELQGLYTGLLEVHALAIRIKQKSPVRCSYLLAIQVTLLWTLAATQRLFNEYTGRQLLGLVPTARGEPAVVGPCFGRSSAMSIQWSLQGSVQLVTAATCFSGGQTLASVILPWFLLAVVKGLQPCVLTRRPGSGLPFGVPLLKL